MRLEGAAVALVVLGPNGKARNRHQQGEQDVGRECAHGFKVRKAGRRCRGIRARWRFWGLSAAA